MSFAVLLQAPNDLRYESLFVEISKISYVGDVRMRFKAEDPNKVRNIVAPNVERFKEFYAEAVEELVQAGSLIKNNAGTPKETLSIVNCSDSYQYMWDCVPKGNMVTRRMNPRVISLPLKHLKEDLLFNVSSTVTSHVREEI